MIKYKYDEDYKTVRVESLFISVSAVAFVVVSQYLFGLNWVWLFGMLVYLSYLCISGSEYPLS